MGISHKTDTSLSSFEDYIKKGLFVNGKNKNKMNYSPPHSIFEKLLSKELQTLFIRCFDDGFVDPLNRPTTMEWAEALLLESKNCNSK